MAIYTGGMRQQDEARAAAERIAAQQTKAEAGETKRKGRSGMFGKALGWAAGEGLTMLGGMALTAMSGGAAGPLLAALKAGKHAKNLVRLGKAAATGTGMFLGKAAAHQATTGKIGGKYLKTSGQVDKIEAGGKYGYGEKEAETLSQALTESRKSEQDWGTLAGDIVGAGAAEFAGESLGSIFGGKTDALSELTGEELEASSFVPGGEGAMETLADIGQSAEVDQWGNPISSVGDFQQGGQVPQMDQEQLMALLALAQMQEQQEQTAYSGTPLEEEKQQTISEMFASQGKTLGGNNTQSLSQMLGR